MTPLQSSLAALVAAQAATATPVPPAALFGVPQEHWFVGAIVAFTGAAVGVIVRALFDRKYIAADVAKAVRQDTSLIIDAKIGDFLTSLKGDLEAQMRDQLSRCSSCERAIELHARAVGGLQSEIHDSSCPFDKDATLVMEWLRRLPDMDRALAVMSERACPFSRKGL